jgi:hypothetical protein
MHKSVNPTQQRTTMKQHMSRISRQPLLLALAGAACSLSAQAQTAVGCQTTVTNKSCQTLVLPMPAGAVYSGSAAMNKSFISLDPVFNLKVSRNGTVVMNKNYSLSRTNFSVAPDRAIARYTTALTILSSMPQLTGKVVINAKPPV